MWLYLLVYEQTQPKLLDGLAYLQNFFGRKLLQNLTRGGIQYFDDRSSGVLVYGKFQLGSQRSNCLL